MWTLLLWSFVPHAVDLAGRVQLERLPPPKKFVVQKNAELCGREKPDLSVVSSIDKGLRHAVVWLDGVSGDKETVALNKPEKANNNAKSVTVKNVSCVYEPRVSVARVGNVLEIKNFDALLHSAQGFFHTPSLASGAVVREVQPLSLFQIALPMKGLSSKRSLDKAGLYDIHSDSTQPWRQAWLWVFDHDYATVTDEAGGFVISDVPQGEHTLRVWHERLGTLSRKIRVSSSGTVPVDIVYPLH